MSKIVYIAHQVKGNIKKNVKSILGILREVHTNSEYTNFIAPYLATLQYLDDNNAFERILGMQINKEFFKKRFIDEMWLCGPKISKSMVEEIKLALEYKITIRCYNPQLKFELDKIIEENFYLR